MRASAASVASDASVGAIKARAAGLCQNRPEMVAETPRNGAKITHLGDACGRLCPHLRLKFVKQGSSPFAQQHRGVFMKKHVLARKLFPLGVRTSIRIEARFRNRRRWKNGVATLPDGQKFRFVPGARLHDLAPGERVTITYDPANRIYVVGNSGGSTAPIVGIEAEMTDDQAE